MNLPANLHRFLWLPLLLGAGHCAVAAEPSANAATCLNRENIRSMRVLDGRNIVFVTRDRMNYNNQLPKVCPGMHRGTPLTFSYSNHKLCAGSLFTVLMRAGASTNTEAFTDPVTNQHIAIPGPAFLPGATCQLSIFGPISDDEVKALAAAGDEEHKSRRRSDRDSVKTEAVPASPATSAPQTPAP
jgi:hypothetical protein